MLLNEPLGAPPLPFPAGAEAAAADTNGELEEEGEVVLVEAGVEAADGDEGVIDDAAEEEVMLVDASGGGATSDLVGWAMLDETMLLEPEDSVPDVVIAIAPVRAWLASRQSSDTILWDLLDAPKKPPGDTAAVGAAAGAGPATVTPVLTASAAGMEERPGMIALPVYMGAPPIPPKLFMGGLPLPHQQPGGAFCH